LFCSLYYRIIDKRPDGFFQTVCKELLSQCGDNILLVVGLFGTRLFSDLYLELFFGYVY
jgi:hypothetical protein